jgi:hypothetical protein
MPTLPIGSDPEAIDQYTRFLEYRKVKRIDNDESLPWKPLSVMG